MRNIYISAAIGLSAFMLTGCADTDIDNIEVEKPQSIADYEYLDAYGSLKDYIDRVAHPTFKLGCGVSAYDYVNKGMLFRLTNNNFDIMTAGNAMKYASVVNDKGEMDFNTVMNFVETAQEAGMDIYGHTLCWHEQQNVKWLNSLIADRVPEINPDDFKDIEDKLVEYKNFDSYPYYVMWDVPKIENGLLVIDNTEPKGANWEGQYFVIDGAPYTRDGDYYVTARIRGSQEGTLTVVGGDWGGSTTADLSFTTEWKEVTVKLNAVPSDGGFVVFQSGACPGKIEIEWVKLHHHEANAVEVETEVTNVTYTDGPFPFYPMGCEPPVINGCLHFEPDGEWRQFFICPASDNNLKAGNYAMYLDITASKDASMVVQFQNGWGAENQHITGNVSVKAGENRVRVKLNDVEGGGYDVILQPGTADVVLDVRSVTVCKVEQLNTIPLTPEEKAEVLEAEMSRWIKGMMDATGGYVKCWDVVNEAISGAGNPRYDLQHAATADASAQARNFYWQDYLGDDFVRIPVKYARQYFEEAGGNPEDLKLFVNDYNLESDWDDNMKLKSLISWIEQWESDGVTKIDGIGSQMHVSYYMNPAVQKSKEEHVVKMLELMAATGKLVRITELDMGLVDENGNDVKTEDVTLEQHKLMGEYYKFIIQKYFEIIPEAQQHGITQWAHTDSPEGSGWRANSPIGLWDLNYNRKPTYAGFAEGLAGIKTEPAPEPAPAE